MYKRGTYFARKVLDSAILEFDHWVVVGIGRRTTSPTQQETRMLSFFFFLRYTKET